MTTDYVIYLGRETLKTAILVLGPILGAGLLTGLIVALFQSVTSIREMTLSLIPKMAAVGLIILVLMPWLLNILVSFTQEMFGQIPMMGP